MQPKFPAISVNCSSSNPLVLVAVVREALRLARVERQEIRSFSEEALALNQLSVAREVCSKWVLLTPNRL